jgi:hypothetical protein
MMVIMRGLLMTLMMVTTVVCVVLVIREALLREKAETATEGVRAELGAMHEAMASLHGEMGAMQREASDPM